MSSKNTNKINVPEARAAMDKFKMEAAADLGVKRPQRKINITEPETLIYIRNACESGRFFCLTSFKARAYKFYLMAEGKPNQAEQAKTARN